MCVARCEEVKHFQVMGKWWARAISGTVARSRGQLPATEVSCLEDGSSATEAFTWSGQRSTNRLVPNVRQDMEELYRNYTETMQGSLWVKDCFSQMRFGDARQTLDVHLSKSWIVVSQFRMESKWNKSGDEAKTSAAFFSALVFAAAAWKARSERAPELKHGLGMPSCLNVSKCPNVSILCILQ